MYNTPQTKYAGSAIPDDDLGFNLLDAFMVVADITFIVIAAGMIYYAACTKSEPKVEAVDKTPIGKLDDIKTEKSIEMEF